MKKQTNPFPTLHQLSPTQWEGDGRVIRVTKIGIGHYALTVGTTDYPPTRRVADIQAIIADVPPVTGSYVKAKSLDSRVLWQSSGGIPVRRMLVGNRGRSEY